MMRPSAIHESAIYAPDLDAAERFYTEVLGLEKITRAGNRHVFFRCGEGVLLVFNPEETVKPWMEGQLPVPPHGARGQCHICFRATGDELDAWQAKLESLGIKVESTVEWPGGGRSIYFRDPAGNSLEFAEPKIWGF